MKHNLQTSIGEVCDRYSICKLKEERTDLNCQDELEILLNAIKPYDGLEIYIDELIDINGSIWSLESDIRKGKEGLLGLEEVGRRALKIRNYNGIRVNIKNTINSLFNQGFNEIKTDHASKQ
jgi:hypothetical protein